MKNADYTQTAVNLCNPPELKLELDNLYRIQSEAQNLEKDLEGNELYKELQDKLKELENIKAGILDMIDAQGSYQDMENGHYALKYARTSKSYDAPAFKDHYEKFIPAVIEEAVNVSALLGLIKGGLINEDDLKDKGITQEKINYAYVIK